MTILEQLENSQEQDSRACALQAGEQARIKHTGQIVHIKKVSVHGIAVVRFRTGGEYFIANQFLEPIRALH